jgi:hypothetical protein
MNAPCPLGGRQRLRDEGFGAGCAFVADPPDANAEIVIAAHDADFREVQELLNFRELALTGRL